MNNLVFTSDPASTMLTKKTGVYLRKAEMDINEIITKSMRSQNCISTEF